MWHRTTKFYAFLVLLFVTVTFLFLQKDRNGVCYMDTCKTSQLLYEKCG